jgi:hypothetical protein
MLSGRAGYRNRRLARDNWLMEEHPISFISLPMRLDILLKVDRRLALVIEPTGDDKLRLTCSSWDDAKIILADEAPQVVGVGKVAYGAVRPAARIPRRRPYRASGGRLRRGCEMMRCYQWVGYA